MTISHCRFNDEIFPFFLFIFIFPLYILNFILFFFLEEEIAGAEGEFAKAWKMRGIRMGDVKYTKNKLKKES